MNNELNLKLETKTIKSGKAIKIPTKEFKDILKQAVSYGMTYVQFKHDLPISAKQRKGVAISFISRYSSQPENLWEWKPIDIPEIVTYYLYYLEPTKVGIEIMLQCGNQFAMNFSSVSELNVNIASYFKSLMDFTDTQGIKNMIVTNAPPGSLIEGKYLPRNANYAFINIALKDGILNSSEYLEWFTQD